MIELEILRERAAIVAHVRSFFDARGYLSVETPQLAQRPIPESHIELFATEFIPPEYQEREAQALFLLPSPEYYLKQLLTAGSGSLYEITHSFRNVESESPWHSLEFTMLEYYTVDADSARSREITTALLTELGVTGNPLTITMVEAFERYAGIALERCLPPATAAAGLAPAPGEMELKRLQEAAGEAGISPDGIGAAAGGVENSAAAAWEDLFQRLFLTRVEPELPRDRPVFLCDYPAAIPTLARQLRGTPWVDRWELYLGGAEVANCYGEENDAERIRSFFEMEEKKKRQTCRIIHPVDGSFPGGTLPRCSGVALGVDRLVMHILGLTDIRRVQSFTLFG